MDALSERDGVRSAVAALLDGASGGAGGALFVVGGAGLGKTTVLGEGRRHARPRFSIRQGRGDAAELRLPFSLLDQALPAVTGWDQAAGASRFQAVQRFLCQAGRPVLLALDDLHWADADSLGLLSFLCRRIGDRPVAVLATLRPWPTAAGELADRLASEDAAQVQRLASLSEAAAAELLARRSGSTIEPQLARRAWRLCDGNPLLLERLVKEMRHDAEPSWDGSARPVRLGIPLERFAGVPPAGFRFAQVASVLGARFRPEVAAKAAGLDEREFQLALDALHRGGLLRASGSEWATFAHPLFRQALHDDLPAPERSRLHRLAFRLLVQHGAGPLEAAKHAVWGRMRGDRTAIEVLRRAGRSAIAAGAVGLATAYFEAAVELAGETASPATLLQMGELLLAAGASDRATSMSERLLASGRLDAVERADALRMLGRALCAGGAYDRAEACFSEAAEAAEGTDPARVVEALLDHASVWGMPPRRMLATATRARELARTGRLDATLRARATVTWALAALLTGDPAGVETAVPRAATADPRLKASRHWPLETLGAYHQLTRFAERFEASQRAFEILLAWAERAGAPVAVGSALVMQADMLQRVGRLEAALALLERAATTTGPVPPARMPVLAAAHARVLLLMGRLRESEAWWQRAYPGALARNEPLTLLWLWHLRGLLLLRQGRFDESCGLYRRVEQLSGRVGVDEPCAVPWARDGIRAYLSAGRPQDASRVLAWVERGGARLPCRWPRIVVNTCRALLAERAGDVRQAEAHHDAALALNDQVSLPIERVRTLIEYGAFLRRTRQLPRARRLLRDAVALAENTGAAWLAEEAQEELKVAGGRRRSDERQRLTAQEARVARLAAGGCSNEEIAQRLVISVKTVECHLHRVFSKLGIGSRRELMRAEPADTGAHDLVPQG